MGPIQPLIELLRTLTSNSRLEFLAWFLGLEFRPLRGAAYEANEIVIWFSNYVSNFAPGVAKCRNYGAFYCHHHHHKCLFRKGHVRRRHDSLRIECKATPTN